MRRHIFVIACLLTACTAMSGNTTDTTEYVLVTRVVDGDTIVIERDGVEDHVRIIGIDAPETNGSDTPQCYADAATEELTKLIEGEYISLHTRKGDDRDKYDRLLRYVFSAEGDVGMYLLYQGYARNYPWFPHPKEEEYREAERNARGAQRGLWGNCTM